jgi:GntR family transcriptional regulator
VLDTLHIERSGVPIYVQIRDQLLRVIGAGVLKPGEKMPTMRQVAVALRIDLNTVRHAYDALARTGAITIQPARGTFVAEKPPKASEDERVERLADLAHRTIASARATGLDPVEVAERIMLIEKGKEARS